MMRKTIIVGFIILMVTVTFAYAATKGHPASEVRPGNFQDTGSPYIFPANRLCIGDGSDCFSTAGGVWSKIPALNDIYYDQGSVVIGSNQPTSNSLRISCNIPGSNPGCTINLSAVCSYPTGSNQITCTNIAELNSLYDQGYLGEGSSIRFSPKDPARMEPGISASVISYSRGSSVITVREYNMAKSSAGNTVNYNDNIYYASVGAGGLGIIDRTGTQTSHFVPSGMRFSNNQPGLDPVAGGVMVANSALRLSSTGGVAIFIDATNKENDAKGPPYAPTFTIVHNNDYFWPPLEHLFTIDEEGNATVKGTVSASALKLTPQSIRPANPSMGMMYTHDSGALCFYDGTSWSKIAGGGNCP
jgi:hypothetical protein